MLLPKLRYWRERRALTQDELAEKANVGARSVAGYEAGAGARPGNVRKLARALDIDVSDLMTEEEAPKVDAPLPFDEPQTERRRREEEAAGYAELLANDLEGFEDLLKAPAADHSLTAMLAHHLYARHYPQLLVYEEMEAAGPLSAPLLAARHRHEAAWKRLRPLMAQCQSVGMVPSGVRNVALQGPKEQQRLRENTG